MVKETAEERIIRARVQITYSNPFFAYLSLYLTIEEDKIGRIPKNAGMSVSPTGHVYYRKEFVDSITDAQLIGCLKHEICLTPDNLICGKEFKTIDKIKIGDLVLNKNGKLERVKDIFKRKINENIFNIQASYSLPIKVTKEHPFLVKKYIKPKQVKNENRSIKKQFENIKESWVKAEDIKQHDLIAIPKIKNYTNIKIINLKFYHPKLIQRQTHILPSFKLTKETSWLLGLYVADGSSNKRAKNISFNLNNYNKNTLFPKIKNILKNYFNIKHVNIYQTEYSGRGKMMLVCSTILATAFKDFCGENVKNKQIPYFILFNKDKEILKSFLEGYFSGDGFYYKKMNQLQCATVSKKLALQLQLAFIRLGKIAHIYNYKRKGIYHNLNGRDLKNLNIYQLIIKEYKRKNNHHIEDKNYIWVKVKKIKKQNYKGLVYNLKTEKTHTYVTNNILVHNCHLFLLHLIRVGTRDKYKFNIAADIVVNTMLLKNGEKLPQGLKPNGKNEFIIMGKIIKNIDSKSADEVYEELLNINIPEEKQSQVYVGFDEHMDGDEKDGKEQILAEPELQELETEWFNRGKTAIVLAQQKGNLPLGMERYVDKLKKVEINWRVVLRRFIQQSIPVDHSWQKRSNRGVALNIYLPGVKKERISIVIGIDTSGSIEQHELTKFLSEIIGIAKTFREVIDMRIMFHDEEVQADYMVKNGSIPQIMAMKPKGGGGTSHKHLLNTIKKEVRDCKCLVSFTDGYSDIQDIKLRDYKFPKLFIINKKGTIPKVKKGDATFIKLKNN